MEINYERCVEILERGKQRGTEPKPLDELVGLYLRPDVRREAIRRGMKLMKKASKP